MIAGTSYKSLHLEVICIEDDAFFSLLDRAIAHIKDNLALREDKWISSEEAMARLKIKSKTTLQKLRDENKIKFAQPEKKWIVYDADSIDAYLQKHSNIT